LIAGSGIAYRASFVNSWVKDATVYGNLVRRALGLLAPDRGFVILLLVFSVTLAVTEGIGVAMLVPIVGLEGGGQAITGIPVIGQIATPFLGLPTKERLLLAAAVLACVLLVRGVVQFYAQLLSALLPFRLQRRIATDSYLQLLDARYVFFSGSDHGQTIAQLREFPTMVAGCVRALVDTVISLMLVAIYVALMMLISWPLTLGALVFMTAIFLALKTVNERKLIPAGHALGAAYARLNTLLQETVLGMKLIRLQGGESWMAKRFDRTAGDLYGANRRMALVQEFQSPLSNTLAGLLVCGLLAGGAMFFSSDSSGLLGMVAVFITCLYRMLAPAVKVSNAHSIVSMNMAGFAQFERFRREVAEAREPRGGRPFAGFVSSLDFEGIVFSYASGEVPALDNVSLSIPKGSMVALVGPSGAGKSTLVGLVARLYEPTAGRLLVDGTDLRDFNLRSWRRKLAVVSQDIVLFNDTVANNLTFGLEGVPRAEIERAAHFAAADEFIQSLPEGYDTVLGDRGARLSGGQQQRLALARAFLVKPEVLLLDEATSQLDSFTEHAVQNAVRAMRGHTTILVVAHRLATVQAADEIIVMDKGRIVEHGGHAALIARRGIYWDMLQHQRLDLAAAG
jgi:ABC-type multidrug transport system fused ATPase/permease subunit